MRSISFVLSAVLFLSACTPAPTAAPSSIATPAPIATPLSTPTPSASPFFTSIPKPTVFVTATERRVKPTATNEAPDYNITSYFVQRFSDMVTVQVIDDSGNNDGGLSPRIAAAHAAVR